MWPGVCPAVQNISMPGSTKDRSPTSFLFLLKALTDVLKVWIMPSVEEETAEIEAKLEYSFQRPKLRRGCITYEQKAEEAMALSSQFLPEGSSKNRTHGEIT